MSFTSPSNTLNTILTFFISWHIASHHKVFPVSLSKMRVVQNNDRKTQKWGNYLSDGKTVPRHGSLLRTQKRAILYIRVSILYSYVSMRNLISCGGILTLLSKGTVLLLRLSQNTGWKIISLAFDSVQDIYEEQGFWMTRLDWVGIRLNQFEMF